MIRLAVLVSIGAIVAAIVAVYAVIVDWLGELLAYYRRERPW